MTEKYEKISEDEVEVDPETIRIEIKEKFYEVFESFAYYSTPFSNELRVFNIMTHVGSNFDKNYEISADVDTIERIENNIRHVSFYVTNNDLNDISKLITIKCNNASEGSKFAGISFHGSKSILKIDGCHTYSCNATCIDCQASMNRCHSSPVCPIGGGVCYVDHNC